LMLEHRIPN
jgi:hypothetical protein